MQTSFQERYKTVVGILTLKALTTMYIWQQAVDNRVKENVAWFNVVFFA